MKKCTKCKKTKDLVSFGISKGYVESYCKECKYEATRKWKKANRKKCNASTKKWISNNKEKYREIQRKTYNKYLLKNRKKKLEHYHKRSEHFGMSPTTVYRNGGIEVLNKLNMICDFCGTTEDLCIHHIDNAGRANIKKGLKPNNNLENLQVLCRGCHTSLHKSTK